MSRYTTGEIAKLCSVTVRTVQYYDTRGILVPSELTEGGRRLYSEDDLSRMKIICFLRDMDLSIDTIGQLLAEEHPERVIDLILEQQEKVLRGEISSRQEKLERLRALRSGVGKMENFTVESIGDIACAMKNQSKRRKITAVMLAVGIPAFLLEIGVIALWIITGIWWPFAVWLGLDIALGIVVSRWFFKNVRYVCPECHKVFEPDRREAFFARHTPTTRKLTCTECGYKGFCVEVMGGEE